MVGLENCIPEPYPWCVFVGDIEDVDMTVEVAFGQSEAATNDPVATYGNLLEVLLLIALNLEVF